MYFERDEMNFDDFNGICSNGNRIDDPDHGPTDEDPPNTGGSGG